MNGTHFINRHARPLMQRLALLLAFFGPFNLVAGAVVTYMLRLGDSFFDNLVFCSCISVIAFVAISGGRKLLWKHRRPPIIGSLLLIAASVALAHVAGSAIAIRILGLPPQNVINHQLSMFFPLLLFVLLASSFSIWFFSNRIRMAELATQAEAEKSRAALIEKQAMQAQLQLLQTQIEPHMLFNTLANLQGLIATDAPRAQHMLDQLIQYLRATLSSSRAERTLLGQEFALMEAYLGLMAVRMGARLSYELHLPDELRDVAIPPMLLQPLVENAVKHGIEPKINGGRITVEASRENGQLALTITDTGLGLEAASGAEGSCIGLANVRERLNALFGNKASLSLSPNTPRGAVARIIIPS